MTPPRTSLKPYELWIATFPLKKEAPEILIRRPSPYGCFGMEMK
jgi:hypothetical protein